MKYLLTFFMVILVSVSLISTAAAAGIQKQAVKNVVTVDEGVQPDRPQIAEDHSYTVYPIAKKKGPPMHGGYTIGITGDYLNFFDALVALNTDGMDGDVNLLVKGDYNASIVGETFPITFRAKIPGSGTYKIVVKPNAGETATIATSAYYNYMVNIDSMMNLEFDGNNGTDNFKLSIVANGTRALTGRTVSVYNGSQFINFKNLTFASASGGSVYRNVDVSGTNRVGGAVKDVEFLNCRFYDNGVGGAEQALYISGYAAINELSARINVRNCVFKNFNGLGTYTGAGIALRYGVTDCIFENNEFYHENPAIIEGGIRAFAIGGTSDKMQNITIRNNNIHDLVSNVAATTCYAIQVSGPTTTANLYAPINIVVDGNTINNIKAPHAASISAVGIIFGNSGQNVTISNNVITNIGGGGVQPQGIRVGYATTTIYSVDNCSIVGNTIDGIVGGHTAASWVAGIQTGYVTNLVISKNKVTNLSSTTIGKNVAGITLWGASGMTQSATVANNFVYLPTASATVSDGLVAGIFDYGYVTNAADIYYNSTYIGGTNFGATEFSVAYYRSNGNITNVKNNIFYNDRAGAGLNVAVEDDSADFTAYASDYNDIYSTSGVTGVVSTALATTLGDWTTLTGGLDVNSKSVAPTYVSNTDLHMKTGTATTLDNAGTPVSVLDDIDGNLRSVTTPDIGADEFSAGAPGAFVLVSPTNGAANVPVNGNLTWDASPNTYTYDVYLDTLSSPSLVGNVTGTSYTYSGLRGSTKYYWKVGAKNDIGTVFATNSPDSFTTAALPPAAPSGITFTAVTATSLTVHWVDNSSNETGFNIYKAAGTGAYALEGTVGADVQLFPVASLSPNVRYHFRVTAYQTVQGESNPAEDSVATLSNTPLAPLSNTITKRGMNLRPSPSDGNPAVTAYAFYDSASDQYVGSKTISGVYTYYFLSATPVWRSRTEWGAPVGTTVVNLLPSTNYLWKAKARNLDGVETVLGQSSPTTTQAPLSVFPAIEGFENTTFPPTDWGRIDVAGDGTVDGTTTPATFYGMWGRASTTTYKGGGCARYLWEQTLVNGADDWLINQPMTLQTGVSYILSFYVRTSGANEKMEVTIGNAPTAAAQTTILAEYNPLFSTSYIFKGIVFTVPSTGTYYIAFHASTPTNQLWIRMDEVKVAVANPYDAAFLGLTQTTGARPMKGMIVGEKTDIVTLSEIPFDRSNVKVNKVYRTSNVSNTLLVSGPVNTNYKLQGFIGQDEVADAFNNNNGILKGTPTSVNLRAEVANIGVNSIPGFAINYMVDSIAQPPFSGGAILPGGNVFANIPFAPTERGMFNAIAATDVAGEGDRSNDTASVALMIYPTPAYNLRYDDYYATPAYGWGTSTPNDTFRIVIGMRYTNPQRGRVGQIDITTKSNRRVGSTYLNVAIPDVWRVRVRAAGVDTNTPGPILYEKKFEGPKYNTVATTLKTMAFGDDAPVIEAGQDFWITVMAESAGVTTGGYPFGLFDGVIDVTHLLPGASYRSYGSDYLDEHSWYAMDAAVLGAGDFGHWALRSIMVPVSNSISGVVYEDKNGNGTKDSGEPALENWEVKLSSGLNLSTLTDANGIYAFNALENGTFTLSETIQSTWHCLTPDSTGSLSVILTGGESQVHNFGNYQGVKPGVQDEDLLATEYRLYQNYPNPFNPNTMIRFSIPNKGHVSLKIHNILGVEVATLVDEDLNPGTYKVSFDGSKFASGLYFYRITSNSYTATMKMLFVK